MVTTSEQLQAGKERKMLAEIFFLQLEATRRADNEESRIRAEIRALRLDHRAPGFRWTRTTAQGRRSTTE